MRREGISLRSTDADPQNGKPRLLDSKSKRTNNNKITIYSQKYTTLVSSQSLPDDSEHIFSTTNTLKSDSRSANFYDSHTQQLTNSQKYSQSSKDLKDLRELDQNIIALIREEIVTAKYKYELKIKDLLEVNARTISELKHTLFEQQKKLAQKEHTILQLVNEGKNMVNRSNFPSKNQSSKRLKLGQFCFLQDKVEDLEVKLKIVLQTLNTGDQMTADKIGRIEERLIRYNGSKMMQYRFQLNLISTYLSEKIDTLEDLFRKEAQTSKTVTFQPSLDSIKREVQDLKRSVSCFASKDWKHENQKISQLKTMLNGLCERVEGLAGSRNSRNQYYLQDEDQFFYPHTERVYESNDDYEHFQADSEEEREKKENKSPNGGSSLFKFPN